MSTSAGGRIGIGWLFLKVFYPVFGWVRDIGAERRDPADATIQAAMTAWVSTIFHVCGAVLIALVWPLWGVVWSLFAAGVLSRRVGARHCVSVPISAWASGFKSRIALGVCAVQPLLWLLTNNESIKALNALGICVALTIVGTGAAKWTATSIASMHACERWVLDLAAPFGVSQQVFDDAGLAMRGDGLIIDPVPAAISVRYELNAFDAALATVHPHLEISPDSSSQRIIIQAASPETQARRDSLTTSGGLIVGMNSAPESTDSWDHFGRTRVYRPLDDEPLVISLADL